MSKLVMSYVEMVSLIDTLGHHAERFYQNAADDMLG